MGNEWPEQTRVVEFHLLNSLPDAHPIIVERECHAIRCFSKYLIPVPVVLSNSPSIQEILWRFSSFKDKKKRLTLRQNPHFYVKLPTSPEEYGDSVKIDPTEDFQHADRFYVLTDKLEHVYIMTDRISKSFSNFWCPQNAIVFKGL
jgi:hypothetical protein